MNRTFVFIALGAFSLFLPTGGKTVAQDLKNQVKVNLLPLIGKTVAVEYERALTERLTAGAMFSMRGENTILSGLDSYIDLNDYIDDPDVVEILEKMTVKATSFALEGRFYTGKKGTFKGFYLAPYFKYADYGASVPISVSVDNAQTGLEEDVEILTKGNMKAMTVGLGVGMQFKIGKRVSLDWRIAAPGYGIAKATVSGTHDRDLTPEQQQAFRNELNELEEEDIPFLKIVSKEVGTRDLTFKTDSPWAGIRTGLSLGFTF